MNLRTYRAYTMAEALAAVKRDLGSSAVILHTRSFRKGGLLGIGRRTIVEITASDDPSAAGASHNRRRTPPKSRTPHTALKAYRAHQAGGDNDEAPTGRPPAELDLLMQIKHHAAETGRDRNLTSHVQHGARGEERCEPSNPASPPVDGAMAGAISPGAPHEDLGGSSDRVAKRFVLQSAQTSGDPPSTSGVVSAARSMVETAHTRGDTLGHDMSAIKDMVGQILQQQTRSARTGATSHLPKKLFDMYLRLISQDMSDELADRVICTVQQELKADDLKNCRLVKHAVRRAISELVPVTDGAASIGTPAPGEPLRVALIGPTGVGKTTTLAKLAATFKLREGRKVGLITSDTYRIAAVDQLRTYANIIGLPLQVALTPQEMEQACHHLRDCDVILIDTAGRSQRDRERLGELKRYIAAADPHEVHLVLSGTASEKVLMQEAELFNDVRADKVILTKLDEAVSFGMLVDVIRKVGKELSYITTGQEVPDHIEPGCGERLASLVVPEGTPA